MHDLPNEAVRRERVMRARRMTKAAFTARDLRHPYDGIEICEFQELY